MTTIVYRDGIMAADTRAYSGGSTPIGQKQKIYQLEDGTMIGVSSTKPGFSETFVNWLVNPAEHDPKSVSSDMLFQALVVKDEQVYYYHDSLAASGPLVGSFFAIGSGEQYALGALSCGATAEAAVVAAAQHDPWTNDQITTLKAPDDDSDSDPDPEPVPNDADDGIEDAEVISEETAKMAA